MSSGTLHMLDRLHLCDLLSCIGSCVVCGWLADWLCVPHSVQLVGVLLLGVLIGSVAEMITAATISAKRVHTYQQKIQVRWDGLVHPILPC